MSGDLGDMKRLFDNMPKGGAQDCKHNALRKKRGMFTFDAYVCGNCSTIFEVKKHEVPPPDKPEPMGSESKVPWGFRARQA